MFENTLLGRHVVSGSARLSVAAALSAVLIVLMGFPFVATGLPVAVTERLSVGYDGSQATEDPSGPAISGDGNCVVFSAFCPLLAAPYDLDNEQVYLRDLSAGTIELVSKNAAGDASNGNVAGDAAVSEDGRYVAFGSNATNLAPGVSGSYGEVYVRDRVDGAIELVSKTTTGGASPQSHRTGRPSISTDGRFVAFESDATSLTADGVGGGTGMHIYVRDRRTGTTVLADKSTTGIPASDSWLASIDASGDHVAFITYGRLAPGDTDSLPDIYIRHLHSGTTERVSVSTSGASGTGGDGAGDPHISANGRYVVFQSTCSGLVSGDTNGKTDVFVRDLKLHTTKRVSVSPSGKQLAKGAGEKTGISASGRYVIFDSQAPELVSAPSTDVAQVFIRDILTGAVRLVSKTRAGGWGEGSSELACISDDGGAVAFKSWSASLVASDTNGIGDVFVCRNLTPLVRTKPVVSRTPTGSSRKYRRRHGVAKFSMSLKVKDIGGDPIVGATVKLQRFSTRSYSWKTYATLTTGSTGIARKYFSAKKRGTKYYRWYVPATGTHYSKTLSEQRIIVK